MSWDTFSARSPCSQRSVQAKFLGNSLLFFLCAVVRVFLSSLFVPFLQDHLEGTGSRKAFAPPPLLPMMPCSLALPTYPPGVVQMLG